jgi:hypothetical protein
VEGDSELGDGEVGVVEVGGQVVVECVGVPVLAPGEEAHGDDGAVGVDTLTDGEGFTGGSVLWSWWPVSPRCREIHSSWSGS